MPPRVSLAMIVKDEEASLARCLGSVADLVDEMIVVDTGSTDRTREEAARLGARVHEFPWADDFAAARNESLRHATGRWIFWLDGDEWLDEENRGRLRRLFAGLGEANLAYVMTQLSRDQPSIRASQPVVDTPAEQVRLFLNHPEIRWRHRVYEQIVGGVLRLGGAVRVTDIVIDHAGYQDPALFRGKNERNLRLAQFEHEEDPRGAYPAYILGIFHLMLGRPSEALLSFRRSLELITPGATFGAKLFVMLAEAYRGAGQAHEALAACRMGRLHYPDDLELIRQEHDLAGGASDLEGARACLDLLVLGPQAQLFPDAGQEFRTMVGLNLATLLHKHGQAAEAEARWLSTLAECPGFARGWLELGEIYLEQGRWGDLDRVVARLELNQQRLEDATVMRARALMARKGFAEARQLLEPLIRRGPLSLRPRLVLSQVLLLEGRDFAAAEQALLEVLKLDPANPQAQHNLALLRARSATRAAGRP